MRPILVRISYVALIRESTLFKGKMDCPNQWMDIVEIGNKSYFAWKQSNIHNKTIALKNRKLTQQTWSMLTKEVN